MPPSIGSPLLVALFLLGIGAVLALDLGVFNRRAHAVRAREAIPWTLFCIGLSLAFNLWIGLQFGSRPALEFLTAYVVEYALSVDNLFVFLVLFSYFAVPPELEHRVLFWGILGAIALRTLFIVAGAALLALHWMIYVFAAFLIFTGVKILFQKEISVEPERNPVVRLIRRFVPLSAHYHGQRFLVREGARRLATPLLLVLALVEATDVVFAVDSIPAVFGVSKDPFIVFTSNIFAVLGLRALYFVLRSFIDRFHYLSFGLGLVLIFVGAKMLADRWYEVPIQLSLAVVCLLLGGAVLASWLFPPRTPRTDGAARGKLKP